MFYSTCSMGMHAHSEVLKSKLYGVSSSNGSKNSYKSIGATIYGAFLDVKYAYLSDKTQVLLIRKLVRHDIVKHKKKYIFIIYLIYMN